MVIPEGPSWKVHIIVRDAQGVVAPAVAHGKLAKLSQG